jgi:hypothetical protein
MRNPYIMIIIVLKRLFLEMRSHSKRHSDSCEICELLADERAQPLLNLGRGDVVCLADK